MYKLLADTLVDSRLETLGNIIPSLLTVVTLGEPGAVHGVKSLLYLSDIFLGDIVSPAKEYLGFSYQTFSSK